ncbi:UNVERIFIED_CONTAM: hypothetical protein FKN15_027031 [Acipenser sinensis]
MKLMEMLNSLLQAHSLLHSSCQSQWGLKAIILMIPAAAGDNACVPEFQSHIEDNAYVPVFQSHIEGYFSVGAGFQSLKNLTQVGINLEPDKVPQPSYKGL